MARDATRRGELTDEASKPVDVLRHIRIDLRVRPFEVDVGDDGGTSVSRPRDVEDVSAGLVDEVIQLDVNEAEAGRGAPVPEQPRLDVLGMQRLAQQGVVL